MISAAEPDVHLGCFHIATNVPYRCTGDGLPAHFTSALRHCAQPGASNKMTFLVTFSQNSLEKARLFARAYRFQLLV